MADIVQNDYNFDFIPNDEKLLVFALEAPLSIIPENVKTTLNEFMANLDIYHSGVGFLGKGVFSLGYNAKNGMGHAILPTIDNNTITWTNDSVIEIHKDENYIRKYWKNSNYITTITKKQFLELKDRIFNEFMPVTDKYALFEVDVSSVGVDIKSATCDSFVKFVLNTLPNKNMITEQRITDIIINTQSPPKLLSPDKPEDLKKIITFYKSLEANIPDVIKNIDTIPYKATSLIFDIITHQSKLVMQIISELEAVYTGKAKSQTLAQLVKDMNTFKTFMEKKCKNTKIWKN